MANNIFTGAINSNSNVAGNWSLGVVPTNGDGNTAVLDASSPNIKIVGSSLQVDGWDSSLFTGDINFNDLDLILRGNAIFGINNNLIIGTGANNKISLGANGINITTNGLVLKRVGSSQYTYNLIDDLNVDKMFFSNGTTISSSTGSKIVVNDEIVKTSPVTNIFNCDIYVKGNMTAFSGNGYYQIQSGKFFYFDGNTTIGDIRFRGTGTVKWLSGTITHTGICYAADTVTFDTNGDTTAGCTTTSSTGINWDNFQVVTSSSIKATASPLRVVNTLTLSANLGGFSNGSKVYVGGSFASNSTTQSGTYEIHLDGTGTLNAVVDVRHSIYFEATCNITLSNNILLNNNNSKLYSSAGCTVNPNGKSIQISNSSATLNTIHIQWFRVYVSGVSISTNGQTINTDTFEFIGSTHILTLQQDINCKYLISNISSTGVLRGNNVTINVSESLYLTGAISRNTTGYLYLNLATLKPQYVKANASYVDSSGGQTIYTGINNTLTGTNNWVKKEGSMAFALTNKF